MTRSALRGMPLSLLSPLRQPDGRPSAETLANVAAQVRHSGALSLPWSFQTRAGETRPHELHLTLTERDGEPADRRLHGGRQPHAVRRSAEPVQERAA